MGKIHLCSFKWAAFKWRSWAAIENHAIQRTRHVPYTQAATIVLFISHTSINSLFKLEGVNMISRIHFSKRCPKSSHILLITLDFHLRKEQKEKRSPGNKLKRLSIALFFQIKTPENQTTVSLLLCVKWMHLKFSFCEKCQIFKPKWWCWPHVRKKIKSQFLFGLQLSAKKGVDCKLISNWAKIGKATNDCRCGSSWKKPDHYWDTVSFVLI